MLPGHGIQNGDLDFDGQSYLPDWPNGSRNFPTTFRYVGPFQPTVATYPQIQFETDAPGSEYLCNIATGVGCTAPPIGAKFYPFWSLSPLFGGLGGALDRVRVELRQDQPNTIGTSARTPSTARRTWPATAAR